MKFISDKYISVYNHKGFNICALKVAVPVNGDEMGYVIDNADFIGQTFNSVPDAICAIDKID